MDNDFDPYVAWLGIEDKQRPLTNYQLLGLAPVDARIDVIESQAQQQHAKLEPFFKGERASLARRIAFEIASAKICLLDPAKKAIYDQQLSQPLGATNKPKVSPKNIGCPIVRPNYPTRPAAVPIKTIPAPLSKKSCPAPVQPIPPMQPASAIQDDAPTFVVPVFRHPLHRKTNRWRLPAVATAAAFILIVWVIAFISASKNTGDKIVGLEAEEQNDLDGPAMAPPVPPRMADTRVNEIRDADNLAKSRSSPREVETPIIALRSRRSPSKPAFPPKSEPSLDVETERPLPNIQPPAAKSQPLENKHLGPVFNPVHKFGTPSFVNLTLPSGTILTAEMTEMPKNWQKNLFPEKATVYVAEGQKDDVQGVFSVSYGRFHGPAAMLHENGRLQTLAFYEKANRHGPLKQWTENGERLFYAEYKHGKKNGIVCLFQSDTPRFIQECDNGTAKNEYLVKNIDGDLHVVPVSQIKDDEIDECREATEQLLVLEQKMKLDEAEAKREAVEWFREEDQRVKQERFVAGTAERRARASARIKASNAQKRAAMQANWRNALGRSGF